MINPPTLREFQREPGPRRFVSLAWRRRKWGGFEPVQVAVRMFSNPSSQYQYGATDSVTIKTHRRPLVDCSVCQCLPLVVSGWMG